MGIPLPTGAVAAAAAGVVSMALTVGLIAAVGVWGGHVAGCGGAARRHPGSDHPVLASGLQAEPGIDPDRLRFSLAGEGD